jgi:hypothetical protein
VSQTDLTESKHSDRLAMLTAIMMTLVSLVAAFVAYQASGRSTYALVADRKGAGAARNIQTTLTLNSSLLTRHYRAYTDYAVQKMLQSLLAQDPQIAASEDLRRSLTEATNLATADEVFFPSRYLNRDGSYAAQRELAEAWAQADQTLDLDPAPHFAEASQQLAERKRLLSVFLTLPAALLCFNLSQNLHPERRKLRIGLAVMGATLSVVALVAALLIEQIL